MKTTKKDNHVNNVPGRRGVSGQNETKLAS